MSRNGSGTYNLPAGQPVVTGTVIDSTVFNTFTADVATALTNSLAKNGETTPTANLPMGGFKHTGIADATARTQYTSAAQTQDNTLTVVGAIAGTADAVTGSLTPAIPAYVSGMELTFLPTANNTTAATINVNGLGVKSIVKGAAGSALVAADLVTGVPARIVYNGTSFYLQNPQGGASGSPLLNVDGTVLLPSYSFTLDPNTGVYRSGSDTLAFATNGTFAGAFNSTQQLVLIDGTAALPSHTFNSDPDTGVYRAGSNTIGFAGNGVRGFQVDGGHAYLEDGAVGAPSLTFNSDIDTGEYWVSANWLGFTAGGSYISGFRNVAGALKQLSADGTVADPFYSFNSDTDTGIYRRQANTVSVSAGGLLIADFENGQGIVMANGSIKLADGSVGTPALNFVLDTDTGFYRLGSGNIGMALDGVGFQVGFRAIPRSTTATTLAIGDIGKCVAITAAINIPISVFSAGDALTIYNDSAGALNLTISAGTLRLAGTATTGTRSINARGFCTIWFNSGGATPEVIASGNVT